MQGWVQMKALEGLDYLYLPVLLRYPGFLKSQYIHTETLACYVSL